jgi:carboxypeptidase Q
MWMSVSFVSRRVAPTLAILCVLPAAAMLAQNQNGEPNSPQPRVESIDFSTYERIRTEGLTHGQAMDFASALSDGIGPRLTGSPNMRKANEWTRDTLAKLGLSNVHLEDWGEFGMGWYQINTWGRIVSPDPEPIWMQAAPWSAATSGPVTGEIVYVPLTDTTQLDMLKGTLKGKIILLGATRPIPDLDQPLSFRYTDEELAQLETDKPPARQTGPPPYDSSLRAERLRAAALRQRAVKMFEDEGVAAILLAPREEGRNVDTGLLIDDNGAELARDAQLRAHAVPIPVAILMTEHYNRLVRLAQAHVPVTVEVNIQTAFTGDHEHGFNTIAEIPGTDPRLKDQVVMAGGHLDSWLSGTGATDNGTGAIVAMEAIRILKALDLKPRRTIRIALWSGEEQGEYGSKGYVQQHAKDSDKFDAYYNLDEGGGKIRGIYTQGNYAVAPIFEQWIAPLKDLGVTAITDRIDIGSDHESFDDAGLPGFEFLQDELDYETRTHHSNLDTVDHVHAADIEQAAIVEAIFLWNTSQREAMMPRKPVPHPENDKNTPIPVRFPGAIGTTH